MCYLKKKKKHGAIRSYYTIKWGDRYPVEKHPPSTRFCAIVAFCQPFAHAGTEENALKAETNSLFQNQNLHGAVHDEETNIT